MKAIITVLGNDKVGIIAGVSTTLKELNVNIIDITQTLFDNTFAMFMKVDTQNANQEFSVLVSKLEECGKELGVSVTMQHEDIFNSMHKI